MSTVRVIDDDHAAFLQDRILIEFLPHTNTEYKDFANTLREAFDIEIEPSKFDTLWVNVSNKRVSKANALKLLEDLIFEAIHEKSENKEEDTTTEVCRSMKVMLREAKLLRKSKDTSRNIVNRDTDGLATFFRRCQDDACIADMDITRENRFLILYKRISQFYP